LNEWIDNCSTNGACEWLPLIIHNLLFSSRVL
jgi:hypothetical protein